MCYGKYMILSEVFSNILRAIRASCSVLLVIQNGWQRVRFQRYGQLFSQMRERSTTAV